MDNLIGGWALTLTCPCGTTGTYRAVVASLVRDHAHADGWPDQDRITNPHTSREALCGFCRKEGAA